MVLWSGLRCYGLEKESLRVSTEVLRTWRRCDKPGYRDVLLLGRGVTDRDKVLRAGAC